LILGVGVAGCRPSPPPSVWAPWLKPPTLRPAAKEQVESLGGKWLDVPMSDEEKAKAFGTGGYAWIPSPEYIKRSGRDCRQGGVQCRHRHHHGADSRPQGAGADQGRNRRQDEAGCVIVDMAVASVAMSKAQSSTKSCSPPNGVKIIGIGNIPGYRGGGSFCAVCPQPAQFPRSPNTTRNRRVQAQSRDEMVKPTLIVDNGHVLYKKPKELRPR
jgi:NAD(P) transhydrogenase subunit alpha